MFTIPHTSIKIAPAKPMIPTQTFVVADLQLSLIIAMRHTNTIAFETVVLLGKATSFSLKVDKQKRFYLQQWAE